MNHATSDPEHANHDFVIGWVSPIGVELEEERSSSSNSEPPDDSKSPIGVVKLFFGDSFGHHTIRMVEAIRNLTLPEELALSDFDSKDYFKKTRARQQAGNALRLSTSLDSVLAHHCVYTISEIRKAHSEKPRIIQVRSLKHPDEARLLRRIYGESFFLIGVHASFSDRKEKLRAKCEGSEDRAHDLIVHDTFESDESGQNTRDLFELCDAFISRTQVENGKPTWKSDLERILRLCTSHLDEVPRHDDFGMQVAYNASFRSGDLSRQVGAALFDQQGRMIAVGRNDAPRPRGGLYQVGEPDDVSDYALGFDPGQRYRHELVQEAAKRVADGLKHLRLENLSDKDIDAKCLPAVEAALEKSPVKDIIEFGRSVHAEMDAILSAAAKGFPVASSTLYTTTFPCHTCARHCIAAGIERIIYVQPYPKSHALRLHGDALSSEYLDIPAQKDIDNNVLKGPKPKVEILPLIGIAPRRYESLFAMWTSEGKRRERKDGGRALSRATGASIQFKFTYDLKSVLQLEGPVLEKYSMVFPKIVENENEIHKKIRH